MIIWRLANLVYMLVEGDCTVTENTKTLDTVRCLDVDRSSIECVDLLPSPLMWGRVEYNTASVLSGFRHSLLQSSQWWSALMHCVKAGKLPSFSATYNSVSSAYCAWSIPNELIMLATGDMYKVNNSGPRTEPSGTPYLRSVLFLSNTHELCSANNVWRNPVQRWSRYIKGITETAEQDADVNSIKCSCKIKLNEYSSESIVGCGVHVVQQSQQHYLCRVATFVGRLESVVIRRELHVLHITATGHITTTYDLNYTVFHKKGPLFLSFIIHSNDDQFTQNFYQL